MFGEWVDGRVIGLTGVQWSYVIWAFVPVAIVVSSIGGLLAAVPVFVVQLAALRCEVVAFRRDSYVQRRRDW